MTESGYNGDDEGANVVAEKKVGVVVQTGSQKGGRGLECTALRPTGIA